MMTKNTQATLNDLRWLLTSPYLIGCHPPLFEKWAANYPSWVTSLEKNTPELPAELTDSRKPPIGRYFEKLVFFWLQTQTDIEALHHNIPVTEAKRTIGEFDILFSAAKLSFHWELSVKFYLGTDDRTKLHNWIGPMARDRFDIKLAKLSGQQLRLSRNEFGKRCLEKMGMNQISAHELVKGRLFHPFDDWQKINFIKPIGVNPHHDKGWWLHQDQIEKLLEFDTVQWALLEKADWFAPIKPSTKVGLRTSAQVVALATKHFTSNANPLLVAAINTHGSEVHRGFIQPNGWPHS